MKTLEIEEIEPEESVPEYTNYFLMRWGITTHIRAGRFDAIGWAVFFSLLVWADWGTGIYWGNPQELRLRWNSMLNEQDILARLLLLRKQGYINFRKPSTPHADWKILIDKFEPTCGDHKHTRLDAFADGSLTTPAYIPNDPEKLVGGYTMFRNGVRDHIKKGRFSPTDWLVFSTCVLWADWSTGNFEGNAQGICTLWGAR
jgi:hypothetical protein